MKDGLQKKCKPCDILSKKENYQKNPEESALKRFKQRLVREYKLTYEDYKLLVKNQNNACAICNKSLGKNMFVHVDHCHISGSVRGILCRWCNLGLGHFKDSIENLESAQKYLQKYNKKAD